MSFDFFNTSLLAFGSKLYAAFVTLDALIREAESNVNQVISDQAIFNEYLNKQRHNDKHRYKSFEYI